MTAPFALLTLLAVQTPQSSEIDPEAVTALEEIEVVGRRQPGGPSIFSAYKNFCFEANRLDGRAAHPATDPNWQLLSEPLRLRLGISDANTHAYVGTIRGSTVLLRIEEKTAGGLRRHRCSLTVTGPHDPSELERGMTDLFGGTGSQRHLSLEGYEAREGWRQQAWTAMPQRGSTRWVGDRRGRSTEIAFVVVVEPEFYRRWTYVVGEMQTTTDPARPVTVLTFSHIFRATTGD